MRKLLLVGVALAIIGIAVMLLPFGRPEPPKTAATGVYVTLASRCKAPIVSAWRRDSDEGWFGYAPLTAGPADMVIVSCKPQARRRLAGGLLFVACGVAIGIVAIRRGRQGAAETPTDPFGIE